MPLLAKISATGSDSTAKLLINSSPLQSRIQSQLTQRGLTQLSGEIDRGFAGISTYSFVYRAEIGNLDGRAWSDDFLRTMIAASIQAATTYDASVSIESRPVQGKTTGYSFGGGFISGGDVKGGDPAQSAPDSLKIPILSDLIDAINGLVKNAGTTGNVVLIAVGVLVVGGVFLILTKPGTVARAVRGG